MPGPLILTDSEGQAVIALKDALESMFSSGVTCPTQTIVPPILANATWPTADSPNPTGGGPGTKDATKIQIQGLASAILRSVSVWYNLQVVPVGTLRFADNEILGAGVAGSSFTLANTPNPVSSLQVFVNGRLTFDYTLVTATITLAVAKTIDDDLRVWYRY